VLIVEDESMVAMLIEDLVAELSHQLLLRRPRSMKQLR
jgi:hypothetical protein